MNSINSIEYAVVCHCGLVREVNQDNFWCDGHFLESENTGLLKTIYGRQSISSAPVFAVFDGLGGETYGEKAAWLVADSFNTAAPNRKRMDAGDFLVETFFKMNEVVCDFASSNRVSSMGATATALLFTDNKVFLCNLGDSRIYLHKDGLLRKLSKDHVSSLVFSRKPFIEQFLGIPKEEFQIEPFLNVEDINIGDTYLLCSDGITDMLSESEIGSILYAFDNSVSAAEKLLDSALNAGGKDNTTAIVCKVKD